MASRPSRGFLVGDGTLRRKNDRNKAAKRQTKFTQKKKKKPEWDDTVSDLNVYKASQDELRRRREAHKSKNASSGWAREVKRKENQSDTSPDHPDSSTKRKQAILQEILFGQDNFQSVLAETDTTMSAVKDLFGDDPKKFLGFPVVTAAPKSEKNSERYIGGPVSEMLNSPTQLSILSESIMRTPALNELSDKTDSESSVSDEQIQEDAEKHEPQRTMFEPQLDLQHYRQLISHESNKECYKVEDVVPDRRMENQNLHSYPERSQSVHISQMSSDRVPTNTVKHASNVNTFARSDLVQHKSIGLPSVPDQVPSNERESQPKVAINPIREGKTKSQRQPKANDTSTSSSTSSLRSLEDLKKMVESLEDEIAEYEMETGRQPTTTTPQSRNFSGYTSSLIIAVTKLMKYLKETEIQRNAEAILRDQILQGFSEQRELIDALTNDIVQTQEQNMKLQSELHSYRQSTDNQLNYLRRELEFVLKSFEYHTVQSTIKTLHSTKPVSLDASSQTHEHSRGDIHTAQGSYRKAGTVEDCLRTQGALIPVSAPPRETSLNNQELNNRGIKDDHLQVTRKLNGCVTAVSNQDQGIGVTQQLDPPVEATQGTRSNTGHGISSVNQETHEDSLLVKSLIKDPIATRDLRNRLQGIALKQRTTAAIRNGSNTTVDKKTIKMQDENLHHPSPHVHFKLPQDNTTNRPCVNQRTDSSLPEKSPCISPIPHQEPVADVPNVQMTGLRKEKHVVVNLPSVWSDISSSTISV
ncbi:spindle and centriole-associated protein 1-like isoform X2 [Actinia tenebrosa]|uniref:Spindle and centriole-associated protein 1 n=1 Tax=Actinia tenebrosa TaxID=6105 RepID=A0A6P8J438_ACTTE|nr:spindle and centriole-associated protein 1-like isoform X2 [Actinia tenebrosa]